MQTPTFFFFHFQAKKNINLLFLDQYMPLPRQFGIGNYFEFDETLSELGKDKKGAAAI